MKLNQFVASRQERWARLEELVSRAGRRPERLPVADLRALAAGYRSVAADLSIARRHFATDPTVGRLERLVTAARALVYERESRREALVAFLVDGYWRLLAERRVELVLAAALLVVPIALGLRWALLDSEAVLGFVPAPFLWVVEGGSTDTGLGAAGLAGFSTYVMFNNIRVTLATFALGIAWGVGSALMIAYNGLILGAVGGLAIGAGNGEVLVAAIAAHGVLELTCIVVGGAAGLSLGRAMLRPGPLTRREALRREAGQAMRIAAGTAPWLVVAGLVEGYASRTGLGAVPTTVIGLALGAAYFGLLVWRGGLATRREARR